LHKRHHRNLASVDRQTHFTHRFPRPAVAGGSYIYIDHFPSIRHFCFAAITFRTRGSNIVDQTRPRFAVSGASVFQIFWIRLACVSQPPTHPWFKSFDQTRLRFAVSGTPMFQMFWIKLARVSQPPTHLCFT
jgi:hypothetical protein